MKKKLLIVESPAKIKTIGKFLGSDFKIMSTMGHIMDLPPKKMGIEVNDTIDIEYVPIEGKEQTIAELCKAASTAEEIYLAPDPDREGEIIAWHTQNVIEKCAKNPNIHRISFNEITKPAVLQAISHVSTVDTQKVSAQQARRVLDRWVGYQVSPILWKKITKGLSAGRVQSVALRLICDRETEIQQFKPEEYWSIEGLFDNGTDKLPAPLTHINKKKIDINNKKKADEVVAKLKKTDFVVEKIEDKKRAKNPLPPFMTSTLQQAAYNRLGFSVKKTMQIAQNLYEGLPLDDASTPVALITYMRTDSLRLSDTALKQARGYIDKTFGKDYLPTKSTVYAKSKGGKAQDAHEAIRPIDVSLTPSYVKKFLPADAAKVYELIWKRFVACQMKPAQYAQRQVTIQGGIFTFKVTGSTLIFDGFLKVYRIEEDKEGKVVIPASYKAKQPVDLKKIDPKQHFTQPPPRYTEASLVKQLEKEGIGRPSTYATILNTIRARDYTELDPKKRFIPTELGMRVTSLLTQNLPKIMDYKFTAHMEQDLDKIAEGELDRDKLLKDFYKEFQKDLEKFLGDDGKQAEPTDITCPKCKKEKLAIRFGKTGSFLGCLAYPDCDFTANFKRKEDGTIELIKTEPPKLLKEKCPKCGEPLRELTGKYGPFTACSGYPKCKYIKQVKADFACPESGHDLVQRAWSGGKFWGCAGYPKCKFVVFGDIEPTPCPKCGREFLAKKTTKDKVALLCTDKKCGYSKIV